jgi:hypothetical protein
MSRKILKRFFRGQRLRHGRRPLLLCASVLTIGIMAPSVAPAERNCKTALSRVAQKEADRAIKDHLDIACKELNGGSIGLDKTKALKLEKLEVCEDGPVVTASIAVYIQCATSSSALIPSSASDTLRAETAANLDTCVVSEPSVSASGFLANQVLQWTQAGAKLKDEAKKAITPYCSTAQ